MFRPGFFYGLISRGARKPPEEVGIKMVGVTVDTRPRRSTPRRRAPGRRTIRVRYWRCFGADQPLKLDLRHRPCARCRSPTRPMANSMLPGPMPFLVCHALTGDQHVANVHPVTGKVRPGGRPLVGPRPPHWTPTDISSFASNVIGGCMGSTGPAIDQCRPPANCGDWIFRSSP